MMPSLKNHLRAAVITLAIAPDPAFNEQLSTDGLRLWRLYANRNFTPIWFDRNGLKKEWNTFRNSINTARWIGLTPGAYHSDHLENLLVEAISRWEIYGSPDYAELSRVEILMTDRLLRYATHLTAGRTRPEATDMGWHVQDGPLSRERLLGMFSEDLSLERILERLQPKHRLFRTLQIGIQRYYRILEQGGWPAIPPGPLMRLGDRDARVRTLRHRLVLSHDLKGGAPDDPDFFDGELEAAVRRFQQRHGLTPDGLVGGATLIALNVPVDVRVHQLLLNFERLRWLPNELGERYLFVNIPDFRMHIVKADRITETLDVIVGRKDRPTPSMNGQMRYMMLNPYWFIPPRIAEEDILPKIQRDPEYLTRHRIRVFEDWSPDAPEIEPSSIDWSNMTPDRFGFKLRQDPADTNALGRAKFVFPNKFEIYIHDTPARVLFKNARRDLSSGCIRIDKPLELALELLDDSPQWTPDALSDALRKPQQTAVVLSEPIPVYILYLTAWGDNDGTVHFREDIYSRDRLLYEAFTPLVSELTSWWEYRTVIEADQFRFGRLSPVTAVDPIATMVKASEPVEYSGTFPQNGVTTQIRIFDRRTLQPQRVGREPEPTVNGTFLTNDLKV